MGQSNDPKDNKGRSVLLIIITNCKINLYSRFRLELYCKCIEIRHPHARIQELSSGGGGGGSRSIWQKSSDNVFFFFSPQVILQKSNVYFKENYHFSRFQRGSKIFQGGSNIFQGGSYCLFPIETHITCDFPGGVRTPCPPSGSALDPVRDLKRRPCFFVKSLNLC